MCLSSWVWIGTKNPLKKQETIQEIQVFVHNKGITNVIALPMKTIGMMPNWTKSRKASPASSIGKSNWQDQKNVVSLVL